MHERQSALKEWLNTVIPNEHFVLTALTGDASFRRYYRVQYRDISRIVMDAPPGKEDLSSFIRITNVLNEVNILTPELLAVDLKQGFLLLSDLGDRLLLNELCEDTVDLYYKQAMDTVVNLQSYSQDDDTIPPFDKDYMLKEMSLCSEWFFSQYLALTLSKDEQELIQKTMRFIADEVAMQPIVLIHRDYHSRNLMIPQDKNTSLAVIDYQDAMYGPVTYDLVSLLKDCYISWPRARLITWLNYFYQRQNLAQRYSFEEFIRAFDFCGLQRHLKILGIFCRLYLRDGKAGYLADLPQTLDYVLECSELYEELHPLLQLFQDKVFLP